MGELGGFGGLFALNSGKYDHPVLVSSTDGVGTKLKIAQVMRRHNTIGIDLVAMVVNDLITAGAEPLFFLDYLAIGQVIPKKVAAIVAGIAAGCRQAGCALLGGETAEHPGVMSKDDYDLAGFGVGVADKSRLLDGHDIKSGDVVIGLAASGLHANGFSLVRKVFDVSDVNKLEQRVSKLGMTLGEELLKPTRIYVEPILKLHKLGLLKGAAHITGGGIGENLARALPAGFDAIINSSAWEAPPIFDLIQQRAELDDEEMSRTFNLGIGMMIIVAADKVEATYEALESAGETAYRLGEVTVGKGEVQFSG